MSNLSWDNTQDSKLFDEPFSEETIIDSLNLRFTPTNAKFVVLSTTLPYTPEELTNKAEVSDNGVIIPDVKIPRVVEDTKFYISCRISLNGETADKYFYVEARNIETTWDIDETLIEKAVYDESEVAVSKCFTSKDIGYVTAGDMIQNYDINTNCYEYDMMNLCDYLVGNSDRHQDNWGYIFNDTREIIGFAPIFDFNHAFEASELSYCLPEQLIGRNILMIDIARQIIKKYSIDLAAVSEIDEYTEFVNKRILMLKQQ